MHVPQKFSQGHGILQGTAGMARHEIRNEVLFLSQFPVGFIEPVLELQESLDVGLSHEVRHVFDDVFRSHFQLTADVVLAEFLDEGLVVIGQDIVIAQARTDEDLLDALDAADFPQELDIIIMGRIEVRAGLTADAVAVAAGAVLELLGTGNVTEVRRRAADVMDIALEARQMGHALRFPDERFMAAMLDDTPLMAGNGTEMAVAETAALAGQAELHFMESRYAAGGIVIGMPAPLEGQFVNGIHLFRRQGQGRRRLDDEAVL